MSPLLYPVWQTDAKDFQRSGGNCSSSIFCSQLNISYRENITHISENIVCQQKQDGHAKICFLITAKFDVINKAISVFKQCFSYINIIVVITTI